MGKVFDIADTYVTDLAALDPFLAAMIGVHGHDEELTEHSPEAVEARVGLARSTLMALQEAVPEGQADRVCREFMLERLQVLVDSHEAGEDWRPLRNFGGPVQTTRQTFDLCPQETEEDWHHISVRLTRVGEALLSLERSLRLGLDRGILAARRQALVCAHQAAVWGGLEGQGTPYFLALAARCPHDGSLRSDLVAGARAATDAYADLSRFLRDEYAPAAPDHDPVGRERYLLGASTFLGAAIDPEATYAWGWEELHRLEAEMQRVAGRIVPGAGVDEVIEVLRSDPSRAIEGSENLRVFLQDLTDRAIAELDGTHFDIPEPIRRCECVIAPPGGAAAMYYTPPSEDFSRPGRTWYPTMGRTVFPVWTEVSTAYHEGVPGHHLQVGVAQCRTQELSRFQRTIGWVSGAGEGWALYAERLMGELGYLDDPGYEMGMLFTQAFRAMRVIVDIGLHLELAIPAGEEHAGERWSWPLALPFVERYTPHPGEFARSELERYLGMPAQAISYKVGEREWLSIREELRRRPDFDLKSFHARGLHLGAIGLDQLRREMLAPD